MMIAISLASFASILCAIGGALVASGRARTRHRQSLEALATQHASALARLESKAEQSTASHAAMERVLALDRVRDTSAHALVADAYAASGAAVAALADASGLVLAWSGDHALAEELAALAPDALDATQPGDELILRGTHGGELRGVCVRFGDERRMLFFASDTRAVGGSAMALLRLKIERLHSPAYGHVDAVSRAQPLRSASDGQTLSADASLSTIAHELGLVWLSRPSDQGTSADGVVRVGGTPSGDALSEVTMFQRIARRSPRALCHPLASIQRVYGERSSAWLALGALGALGSVTVAGAISDEPNTLPRIAASIARRVSLETSRAA